MAVFQILATVKHAKSRSQLVNQLIRANFSVTVLDNQVRVTAYNWPAGKAIRTYRQIRTRVIEAANRFAKQGASDEAEQPTFTTPSLQEAIER